MAHEVFPSQLGIHGLEGRGLEEEEAEFTPELPIPEQWGEHILHTPEDSNPMDSRKLREKPLTHLWRENSGGQRIGESGTEEAQTIKGTKRRQSMKVETKKRE